MKNVWHKLSEERQRQVAEAYRGKTLLVTGGRGYLGAALTEALSELECNLILLDHSPPDAWRPKQNRARISFVNGDISAAQTWESALAGTDYIFHFAGLEYRHRESYDAGRDLEVTIFSVRHMLDALRRKGLAPKIIYCSSANLFGRAAAQPVNEDTPDDPLTLWAVHKLMAEHYLRIAALEDGVQSITLRLANVYGPTPRYDRMGHVVLNRTISRALSQQPLFLYANRDCLRDFLYIDDAVRALLLAGAAHESTFTGGYFVIGSGQKLSIEEIWTQIAKQIERQIDRPAPVLIDDSIKLGMSEIRNFVADTRRFQQATGWTPQVELKQGIELTIDAMIRMSGRAELPTSI